MADTDTTDDEKKKHDEQMNLARMNAAMDLLGKGNFLGFLFSLLGIDDATLENKLQISREDIQEELGPEDGRASRDYSDLGGENGPLGTGRAISGTDPVAQLDVAAIESISVVGSDVGQRTADLARKFVGQHEVGNNGGAMVRLMMGYEGDAWCGGFAHYILDKTMPGVYDQADFRSARSYADMGKKYGVFHERGDKNYVPKAGDVLVFSRSGDPSKGHVGVVTGYDATTHKLTYVSGNDGNAVREREIDMSNPPRRLLGFTDSEGLAKARHIAIETPAQRADENTKIPTAKPYHAAFDHPEVRAIALANEKKNTPVKTDGKKHDIDFAAVVHGVSAQLASVGIKLPSFC